jgi:hypothetical protein
MVGGEELMSEITMTEEQYGAVMFAAGVMWGLLVHPLFEWGLWRPLRARLVLWRARRNNRPGNSQRWALMTKFEIPQYDKPLENYLTRWRIIQTPFFAVYLHKITAPDSRPTLHDHPWNFLSVVLRGGYHEVRRYDGRGDFERDDFEWLPSEHHIRRFNFKRATDTHYITVLDRNPTWTLLLVGRRKREWGFVDRDGTWTVFYDHPHGATFNAAMKERERVSRS